MYWSVDGISGLRARITVSCFSFLFSISNELLKCPYVPTFFKREGIYIRFRNNQCHPLRCHFIKLLRRYTLLKCEQVFIFNTVCLINNLTPPIFAGCLCTKEHQFFLRIANVMISSYTREYEVRLFVPLGYRLRSIGQTISVK